jgi:hypothetical protein
MMGSSVDRERFWKVLFPRAWRGALLRMATCDGRVPLSGCEIVPRWEKPDGRTIMRRTEVFAADDDVVEYAQREQPDTLQIGGKSSAFAGAVAAYFVLDVDVSDYNRAGCCPCDRSSCCNRCWDMFMVPARQVTEFLMRELMGFRFTFAVYSGARGFHQWVLDERVLGWTNEQRLSVVRRLRQYQRHEAWAQHIYRAILLPRWTLHYPGVPATFDTVMGALYPRYDEQVSRADHLKKMPLLPHQRTRNVSLPLHLDETFLPQVHAVRPGELDEQRYDAAIATVAAVLDACARHKQQANNTSGAARP